MEANNIEDIQVPEQDDPPDLVGDHTVRYYLHNLID